MTLKSLVNAVWILLVALLAAMLMLTPLSDAVALLVSDTVAAIQGRAEFVALFALLLLLSLWLFAAQFSSGKKDSMPRSVVLQAEEGEVRISLNAIDTLVQQAANEIKGVREVKTSFFTKNEGLGVYIRATVTADGSIPELSTQVQKVVRDHVLRIAGIHIEEVKVLIENVTASNRNRVELR